MFNIVKSSKGFCMDYDEDEVFDTELEALESHAKYFPTEVAYPSEKSLSDAFDELVEELGLDTDDSIMIDEEFKNWADGLCEVYVLHRCQYDAYCYVGKYCYHS